jgi:hypothetical protein
MRATSHQTRPPGCESRCPNTCHTLTRSSVRGLAARVSMHKQARPRPRPTGSAMLAIAMRKRERQVPDELTARFTKLELCRAARPPRPSLLLRPRELLKQDSMRRSSDWDVEGGLAPVGAPPGGSSSRRATARRGDAGRRRSFVAEEAGWLQLARSPLSNQIASIGSTEISRPRGVRRGFNFRAGEAADRGGQRLGQ